MKSKTRRISSKLQIILIMMIFVIPLVGLMVFYNFYNMHALNSKVAQTNENITLMYKRSLERDLKDVESYIANFLANDSDCLRLRYSANSLKTHLLGQNIREKFTIAMEPKNMLGGLFFYSEENRLHRAAYKRNYSYGLKEEMKNFLFDASDKDTLIRKGWFLQEIGGRSFLLRVLGNNGIYSMCAVDLEYVEAPQDYPENGGSAFLFFADSKGMPATEVGRVEREQLAVTLTDRAYYITGSAGRQYFVVQSQVFSSGIRMLYAAPYEGLLTHMDVIQFVVLLGSLLILLLIFFSFWFLKRFYLRPLDSLVRTMEEVRDGKLDAKIRDEYQTDEFARLGHSFNQMMDEIQGLKIASYEQHIEIQQAQMQYLQIQIRPHFFLNCLKNLYALVQEKKYAQTQELILTLSQHLRFLFRDNRILVPVEMEVANVKNYIALQQMCALKPPVCQFEIDQRVNGLKLPPLSLLTFVENSVKYGVVPDRELQIFIRISLLQGEEESCVCVVVGDNGGGFSQEALSCLEEEVPSGEGVHIGIQNVRQRFRLIYGDRCSFLFSNRGLEYQPAGAEIQIFFPYEQEEQV